MHANPMILAPSTLYDACSIVIHKDAKALFPFPRPLSIEKVSTTSFLDTLSDPERSIFLSPIMTQTPSAAWIACALCAITIPLCVFPLYTQWKERNSLLQSHSRAWHTCMVLLWTVILISHMCLIVYSITAATEMVCRDGSQSDFGWTVGPPSCERRIIMSVVNILEYFTAPFYPMFILSTYVQIRPTKSKQVQKRLQFAVAAAILVMAGFTAILIFASVVDAIMVISLNPRFQPIAHQADALYHHVFDLWAASLILLATCSLVSAIRLIPFLNVHQKQSSGQLSRFKALATARLSNASTSSRSTPISGPSTSHPGHQGSTGSHHTVGEGSTPASSAIPATDARSREVTKCIRQLKAILLVLTFVLVGDVVMIIMVESVPDVLFTVLGWLSCRIVSISLFAAINLIRKTVIARRKVPNPAVGSLATEWQGATTRKA